MLGDYIRMALNSISTARWRSFLTMLGVVIGVVSVVTIVSLGEGVKNQVKKQINQAGSDLITVRPGNIVKRGADGSITSVRLINLLAGSSLSDTDILTVQKTPGVQSIVPFGHLDGLVQIDDQPSESITLIGVGYQAPDVLSQKLLYGSFFTDSEKNSAVAVISRQLAVKLFGENVPLGRSFKVRGQTVVVQGIFDQFANNPLTPGIDYNSAIFLPFDFAEQLSGHSLQVYQILLRPASGHTLTSTVEQLNSRLSAAHGGQTDFAVLQAADNLAIANTVLPLLTGLVAAVAAISLIVGGIGIMNIMLVSVSERTHEIGIRKSVGATKRQILGQFLVEAMVLSTVGGIIGVLCSLLANYFIRLWTNLEPAINLPIMLAAVAGALVVGMFFGMTPALRAAHKDPIEALRRI